MLRVSDMPTLLTDYLLACYCYVASAKSEARIGIRQKTKAYSRLCGFFVPEFCIPPRFMAGLLGLPPGRPVPFVAGYANPDNSATRQDIGMSAGGSNNKGA